MKTFRVSSAVGCLAAILVSSIAGCDGCRRAENPSAPGANGQAPLEDYSSLPPRPFPSDRRPQTNFIKPGHWFSASQPLRSNKVDVRGELRTMATPSRNTSGAPIGSNVADDEENSVPAALPGRLIAPVVSERTVVLPKGQMRRFDVRMLAPRQASSRSLIGLSSQLNVPGQSVYIDTASTYCQSLQAHEYLFVVLTSTPERFARLQTSDWARPFQDPLNSSPGNTDYRLVFPGSEGVLSVASTVFDWTSTAVVFWDDLSPDSLTPLQRQALLDWTHFGGRIIFNGSNASSAIAATSFSDLAPIRFDSNVELEIGLVESLLQHWSVDGDESVDFQIARLEKTPNRIAVGGELSDASEFVTGTGELIAKRRVGRGTVVQSRFDLASDWLANWSSFDSFFNAVILNRPAREFVQSETTYRDYVVVDEETEIPLLRQQFSDSKVADQDLAPLNSSVRFASRDLTFLRGLGKESIGAPGLAASTSRDSLRPAPPEESLSEESFVDDMAIERTRLDGVAGVAGWTDTSDLVQTIRAVLRAESGIEIPRKEMVLRSLGIYILILVPLNFLVFWLVGRLEYSWLAAPLIAGVGAIWVAREAQLDIGFARSRTELAILELPAGYSRGHMTRVMALYNSLSTEYDIQFASIDAVAAPMSVAEESGATTAVFEMTAGDGPRLTGFRVGSNQVRLVHSEEMIDVGGTLRREADTLINETNVDLVDAFVLDRTPSEECLIASVSSCSAGGRVRLRFRPLAEITIPNDLPTGASELVSLLTSEINVPPGATRVIGRLENRVDSLTIVPDVSQSRETTIVLAHLAYMPEATPKKDVNLVSELLSKRPQFENSVIEVITE